MLKVKMLDPRATVPTVAHLGEDLAYDLYALEDTLLDPGEVTKIRTGIAVEAFNPYMYVVHGTKSAGLGLLMRDRSSMAAKGITVSGGVIDAGYRGEIVVMLTFHDPKAYKDYLELYSGPYQIRAGDKIAQMIPVPVLTGPVEVVKELSSASRGERGFGSSGK